jgi:hypothetical protein
MDCSCNIRRWVVYEAKVMCATKLKFSQKESNNTKKLWISVLGSHLIHPC